MTHATWLGAVFAGLIAAGTAAPAEAQRAPGTAGRTRGRAAKVVPPADIAELAAPDLEVATRAAIRLGASPLPAAHEVLLDALALGLPPDVAVGAIGALAARPAPGDVRALRRYAGHHNPSVRAAAIGALADYADPSATAEVVAGLRDPVGMVRSAAATAAGRRGIAAAVEPMLALLALGEESSARGLAQLADLTLARRIADLLGQVPDDALALALGGILKRPDFGPDPARVELVRAIAKIQAPSAVTALSEYLAASPKTPPRESRAEATMVVDARRDQ